MLAMARRAAARVSSVARASGRMSSAAVEYVTSASSSSGPS
jgi:hypothetical protein